MSSGISWRLSVQYNDKSGRTVLGDNQVVGGTVVASPKSVEKPILFNTGETLRMLNMFGVPTKANQGLLEAIEYNKTYPLWCCSPSKFLKKSFIALTSKLLKNEEHISNTSEYLLGDISGSIFTVGQDFNYVPANTGEYKYEAVVPVDYLDASNQVKVNGKSNSTDVDDFVFDVDITTEGGFSDPTTGINGSVSKVISPTGQVEISYILTADDVFQVSKNYYVVDATDPTGYKLADVSALIGEPIPANTYYEQITTDITELTGYKIELTFVPETYVNSDFYLSYLKNYSLDSEVYGFLVQRNQGKFNFNFVLTPKYQKPNGYFECVVYGDNYTKSKSIELSKVNFALNPDAVDGFDNKLNFELAFENNDYFEAVYNDSVTDFPEIDKDTFGNQVTFSFSGIDKDETVNGTDFVAGYAHFQERNKYPVKVFFEGTGDSVARNELKGLRGPDAGDGISLGSQPFAIQLYALNGTTVSAIAEESSQIPMGRGYAGFCAKMKIFNAYSNRYNVLEGVPIGDVARRYSDSLTISYGGYSPAWIDENGVGGQLLSGRIQGLASSQKEFTEAELKELDETYHINPISYTNNYGAMIVSRRTTFDGYSDWSFVDYSMMMDYIVSNVMEKVLPYNIVKVNDSYHRKMIECNIDALLRPMQAINVVDEYKVKCDEENNNEDVKMAESMVVELAVKFTSHARTIKFIFTNTPQNQTVSAMFV